MYDEKTVQYQMRTATLTDNDYLSKLPTLINISDLTPQQRNVLETYMQFDETLDNLHRKKWNLEKDKTIASVKQLQIDTLQKQINAEYHELNFFKEEQATIVNELLAIARFRMEEEERKMLEEWRKARHSSAMHKQVSVSDTQQNVTLPSSTTEPSPSATSRISIFLSSLGGILYYITFGVIAVFPIVMVGMPFWVDLILVGIMLFIPATSSIFWVWGLIAAILGPQDSFAIIYYILFASMFLPFFIKLMKK